MKMFMLRLRHEFKEIVRSKRLYFVPLILILLAVTQPVLLYFLPDLIESGGNLPEGATITIPEPSPEEVMQSVSEQLNQIGMIVILLAASTQFSHEREWGTLAWLRSLRIGAGTLVFSKWLAQLALASVGLSFAYLSSYYYTMLLFDAPDVKKTIYSLLLLLAFTALQLAFLTMMTSILRSSLVSFLCVFSLGVVFSMIGGIDTAWTAWIPWQTGKESSAIFSRSLDDFWPLALLVVASIVFLFIARRLLKWTNA